MEFYFFEHAMSTNQFWDLGNTAGNAAASHGYSRGITLRRSARQKAGHQRVNRRPLPSKGRKVVSFAGKYDTAAEIY